MLIIRHLGVLRSIGLTAYSRECALKVVCGNTFAKIPEK